MSRSNLPVLVLLVLGSWLVVFVFVEVVFVFVEMVATFVEAVR